MSLEPSRVSPEAEADRLLTLTQSGSPAELYKIMHGQFSLLHVRTQVLLGLSGITITSAAFSGRHIVGAGQLPQGLAFGGLALIVVASLMAVWGVMPIRWLTQHPGVDLRSWLLNVLAYRDRKTHAYRRSVILMVIGLALYASAIGLMLLIGKPD